MKIITKVKEIRESKNITIEELSKKSEVDIKELQEIENGNTDTDFSNIVKIANTLEVSVEDLYVIKR